jgi:hypothetical protein
MVDLDDRQQILSFRGLRLTVNEFAAAASQLFRGIGRFRQHRPRNQAHVADSQ